MKRSNKVLIWILCICAVAAIATTFLIQYIFTTETDNEDEMLNTVQEWGRLAPLPASVSELQISAEGSVFTRSFRTSFYLPNDDLMAWIEASPGLQDAQIQIDEDLLQKYTIKPGEGAQYAQAVIDFDSGLVQIYTYWS